MQEICKLVQQERVSLREIFNNKRWIGLVDLLTLYILEILQLLEIFGAGTACIVSPVERINYMGSNILVPTMEQEKPLFERCRETLTSIQYGKIDHPWAVTID